MYIFRYTEYYYRLFDDVHVALQCNSHGVVVTRAHVHHPSYTVYGHKPISPLSVPQPELPARVRSAGKYGTYGERAGERRREKEREGERRREKERQTRIIG